MMDIYKREGEGAMIKRGDDWMPLTEGYCKGFDIDLKFGKMGEEFTSKVFEGDTKVEVKTERDIWKTTGNICIEIRCNGKPSGLSTTESSTWIHLLAHNGHIEGGFIFKVDNLKEKLRKLQKEGGLKMVMGGDNNASQMVLLPIKELF
jgi:hypothetical protein|tara:strand:+ start:734 stop:1177 length:444 start_codon:yes stop_codon:yes gene_type:complete